ncbi:MAG: hypothetical protein CMH56_11675 [Myxococcales bacterium]|nr:hypothetical protein [Myxococcales bacterium]
MAETHQEQKRLVQGLDMVRDLAVQLRKVLVSYAPGKSDSTIRQQLEKDLFSKLSGYCDVHGLLALDCFPFELRWENETVYQSDNQEDAIAHALYCDGINRVTFRKGLTENEVISFCEIWAKSLAGQMSHTQNIVTETWEADMAHIELDSKRHFDLILHADEQVAATVTQAYQSFSQWLTPKGLWRKTKRQDVLAHVVTEKEAHLGALGIHQLDGLAPLVEEDLTTLVRGVDLPMTFIAQDLLDERLAALEEEAEKNYLYQGETVEKIIRIFWQISQKPQAKNAPMLLEGLWRAFDQLIGMGALLDITQVLSAIQSEEKDEALFSGFVQYFERPQVLDQLIPSLDQTEQQKNIVDLLSHVRSSEHARLFPYLKRLKTDSGLKSLIDIIAAMGPDADTIVSYLSPDAPRLVEILLVLAQRKNAPLYRKVRDTVLNYEQPAMWLLVLKNMPRSELLERKRELLERIPRAEKDYERFLFNVLVNEKDPNIVPYVEKKINSASLTLEERKRWVHALAAIGGEKSLVRLRRILGMPKLAVDLRITAALSLGKLNDEESRSLLQEISKKKLFGNKALKEACLNALRRMDGSSSGKEA